jgi:Protein of unknown function (DUF3120)
MHANAMDVTAEDRAAVVDMAIAATTPRRQDQAIQPWMVLAAACFLVSVPVFIEAPMVRYWPWASLVAAIGWAGLSAHWQRQSPTSPFKLWGNLLVGFTWTWICGAIFWGWLRWEPLWHIPVEALALPIALFGLQRRWAVVGQMFYLGSLLGTTVTDTYFYRVGLIPAWKQLMVADPDEAGVIFHQALQLVYTPWGLAWAVMLASLLVVTGMWAWQQRSLHWVAFSGAVLSTILVDALFWVAAVLA